MNQNYINKRPCVVVAPDYRKAHKEPYPAALNDCYDTLLWIQENADELGIKADKFVVAGHSAGGGLTAAVTLKACDTGEVDIAFQMPIYPMIDHRQNTESAMAMDQGVPAWNARNNALGWKMYLRDVEGDVPPYASPSLATNYKHMPPTITFVGDLEPFKDETINYVEALRKEGIPVKFELFEGAFHAFETVAKNAGVSKKANKFQYDAWAEYYDQYLT
jgi:acetyl esterase/lipase